MVPVVTYNCIWVDIDFGTILNLYFYSDVAIQAFVLIT
jgi:hypothetical protein